MQTDPFEALADPTRRRIVEALRGGERPVNDIVDRNLGLRLLKVTPGNLTFADQHGFQYVKNL